MTINVHGYAAPSVKAALTPYQFERRDIRADDVVIEITVAYVIRTCMKSTMTGIATAFTQWCLATR